MKSLGLHTRGTEWFIQVALLLRVAISERLLQTGRWLQLGGGGRKDMDREFFLGVSLGKLRGRWKENI
jgi:hypothetical protein